MSDEQTLEEMVWEETNERVSRDLRHRAQVLTELSEHPGWALLKQEIEDAEEGYMLALAKQIPGILAQEKLSYALAHRKGFFDGFRALLAEPERALNDFDAAWSREYEKIQALVNETTKEEDSPYA